MRLSRLLTFDFAKRVFDVLGSALALVLLWPVLAVVAVLIRERLGRPVIFTQPRPGLGGRVFTLYKFRTMRAVDETRGPVTDEERLSPFGATLRSMSLDELPTLVNVLKGDMSLVGPRPLLVEYLPRYTEEQARRHEVRPGVTGLAQVSGRNAISWDEKFRLDIQYVDSRSVGLDVRILFRTVNEVLSRNGINHDDHATMTKFGAAHG